MQVGSLLHADWPVQGCSLNRCREVQVRAQAAGVGLTPAKGDCTESMSSGLGRPVTSRMRSSWFMVEVPGKMGLPLISSPRMQPAQRQTPGWQAAQPVWRSCRPALPRAAMFTCQRASLAPPSFDCSTQV